MSFPIIITPAAAVKYVNAFLIISSLIDLEIDELDKEILEVE